MAKKQTALKKTEKALTKSLEEDAGAGFENQTGDDIVMPVVWLLQALSPQVSDDNPKGSKPGMLMNSVTEELVKELLFVPAITQHEFCEFVPRVDGGGFVRVHAMNSQAIKKCKATQPFGKYQIDREGGGFNEIVEFFSVFGVVVDEVSVQSFAVLRFKSTKIKVYKQFNTRMQTCQIPRSDGNGRFTPAINSHVIRVGSVKESKNGNDYFNFTLRSAVNNNMIASLIGAGDPRYKAAAEVRELVNSGRATAEYAEAVINDADNDTPF